MKNYLKRTIGIWYKDYEWAKALYKELLSNLPPECVLGFSDNRLQIILKDYSTVSFVKAEANRHMCRFSETYLQGGFDYRDVYSLIDQCKTNYRDTFIINTAKDIIYSRNIMYPQYDASDFGDPDDEDCELKF